MQQRISFAALILNLFINALYNTRRKVRESERGDSACLSPSLSHPSLAVSQWLGCNTVQHFGCGTKYLGTIRTELGAKTLLHHPTRKHIHPEQTSTNCILFNLTGGSVCSATKSSVPNLPTKLISAFFAALDITSRECLWGTRIQTSRFIDKKDDLSFYWCSRRLSPNHRRKRLPPLISGPVLRLRCRWLPCEKIARWGIGGRNDDEDSECAWREIARLAIRLWTYFYQRCCSARSSGRQKSRKSF